MGSINAESLAKLEVGTVGLSYPDRLQADGGAGPAMALCNSLDGLGNRRPEIPGDTCVMEK
jgi:hypothetical protein